MYKKYILVSIFASTVLLLSYSFVSAESVSVSVTNKVTGTDNVSTKTEVRARAGEKFSAVRKTRILNFSNKIIVRLEATVERIEKLIARIEARITKIELNEKNIKLEQVRVSLDEAKQKLALVKVDITKLKNNFDTILDADDPKKNFEEIRTSVSTIRDGLKEVHRMLVKLIGDIKGLRVGI